MYVFHALEDRFVFCAGDGGVVDEDFVCWCIGLDAFPDGRGGFAGLMQAMFVEEVEDAVRHASLIMRIVDDDLLLVLVGTIADEELVQRGAFDKASARLIAHAQRHVGGNIVQQPRRPLSSEDRVVVSEVRAVVGCALDPSGRADES